MRRLAVMASLGLLAAAAAQAQVRPESPMKDATVRSPRQRAWTTDAGEGYRYRGQFVPLHRSLNEIAVVFEKRTTPAGRRKALAALKGAEVAQEIPLRDAKVTRMRVPRLIGRGRMADPVQRREAGNRLKQVLADARRLPGVRFVQPVFVNPATGGTVVLTDELVAKLAEGKTLDDVAAVLSAEGVSSIEKAAGPMAPKDELLLRIDDPSSRNALQLAASLDASGLFAWVEPNFLQEIRYEAVPNDPGFINLWHLDNDGTTGGLADADVDAPEAWDLTTGSPAITIAVVDDGVERSHEDLQPNIYTNPGEIAGNGLDDDGNGLVDDVNGWDFADDDNGPDPGSADDNHGTAVAGVAAARGNNALGVTGACQTCKILPVRVPSGLVDVATLAAAIRYAGSKADVVSNSWGLSGPSATVQSAIQDVTTTGRGGKGAPVLFASGNGATGLNLYGVNVATPGVHRFRWTYSKDFIMSDGDDTAWLAWIYFPDFTLADFESGLPAGFTGGGDAPWSVVTDPAHSDEGAGLIHAAKAGTITHSQSSYLETLRNVDFPGPLFFYMWVSSEAGWDGVQVSIDYDDNGSWDVVEPLISGVPAVEAAVGFPASAPESIAVGASSDLDYRSAYSQFGSALAVVAPSNSGPLNYNQITTTDRTPAGAGYDTVWNYTDTFGGTSSSTPLASGVVGLMLSRNPDLTEPQVRQILQDTTDQVGPEPYVAGRNDRYGHGRINAYSAVLAATPHTLAVTKSGTGSGTVTSDPAGIDCGLDCGEVYTNGVNVTLQATPDAGSTFVGWSGACTGTGACALTVTTDAAVNAEFASTATWQLDVVIVSMENGTGTVNAMPPGVNCGPNAPGSGEGCSYPYTPGDSVTLTAFPESQSVFVEWDLAGACGGSTSPTCTVTMTDDTYVGAIFRGRAELSLQKADSADPVAIGANVIYTLTATNAGPLQATNVTVTDVLPDSLTFVAMSAGCSRVGQTVTCVAASLDVGLDATFTIEVTASAAAAPSVTNTASVTADQADTDLSDNSAWQTTTVATSEVRFLTATARTDEIKLEWMTPPLGTYLGTIIYYNSAATFTGCAPPANVGEGTFLATVGGGLDEHQQTVHSGGLLDTLTYCYSAFVDLGGGSYSSPVTVSARPMPAGGPAVWGYSAKAVATSLVAVGSAINAVANDRVLHGMVRGETGGDWPASWTPFAMMEPAQHRPTSLPLAYGTATRQIILNSQDGRIYSVDPSTGQQLWQSVDLGMLQAGTTAWLVSQGAERDTILIGTRNTGVDNTFYAIDPDNRQVVWSFGPADTLGPVDAMAAVDYALGQIYVTSEERFAGANTVFCLDLRTGAPRWSVALGSVTASPVYRNGRVYVGTATHVHAIDAVSGGAPLWSFPTSDGAVKWAAISDRLTDDLYFSTDTTVWSLSDTGGGPPTLNWSTTAIADPTVPMYVTGENRLYVGSSDGRLWQLDTSLMASDPPAAMTSVLIGDGEATVGPPTRDTASGLLHLGTEAGVIYAIRQPFAP